MRSKYEYAFWVESDIKQPLGAPGSNPFSDPEFTTKGVALHDVKSVESRRLRARFSDTRATLESEHVARPTVFVACPTLGSLGLWGLIDLDLVRVFGPPGGGGEPRPIGPRLLAASGDRFSQAYLLRPAQGTLARVDLGPDAAGSWVATATGTGALFAPSSLGVGGAALAAAPDDSSAMTEPDLLLVERGVAPARWSRLAVYDLTDTAMTYDIVDEGSFADGVGSHARLLADPDNATAVLYDPDEGVLRSYDPVTRRWIVSAPGGGALVRDGAALWLHGSHLYVVSGAIPADRLTYGSDGWLVDIFSGAATKVAEGLPARRDAELAPGSARTLMYVGGADVSGTHHDDAWRVPVGSASGRVTQLFADTPDAATFDASTTAVAVAPGGDRVLRWTLDDSAASRVTASVRTDMGWTPLDLTESAPALDCAPDDPLGGKLCAGGPAWWAGVGRHACSTTSGGGACGAASGTLRALQSIPGRGVVAAGVEDGRIWVLGTHALELWTWNDDGSGLNVTRTGRVPIAERAWSLAVGSGTALVATDDGVRLARATSQRIDLGGEVLLCGAPTAAARLGESTWAVATTLGVELLGLDDTGALVVLSRSLLVPDGHGGAHAWPGVPAGVCRGLRHLLPPIVAGWLREHTALAPVAPSRLLLASGALLYDLDTRDLHAPVARSSLGLDRPLIALRADAVGGRAYGVAAGCREAPVFDLRGAALVEADDEHDVAGWVQRDDAGQVSLRVDRGRAQVAEVAR